MSTTLQCLTTIQNVYPFEQTLCDRLQLLEHDWYAAQKNHPTGVFSTLAFALKAKDPQLYRHSYQVQYFASLLSDALSLTEDEKITIELGALFHDIGKLAISDAILQKPSRLTRQEYAQVQQHPQHGAFILSQVGLLDRLIPVAYYHHERWDGDGYPNHLQKEFIPFSARIVSIADAFEVMISQRTYKKPMTISCAFAELRRCAGTQFDPELVNVFCAAITDAAIPAAA
ncbi:MAG: HD-GYP domain-containing protein [Ktedonobacteraceae bacterium]